MSTFIPCKINSPQMQYCVIIFCCHYMMNKDYNNNNNNNNECWPQVRRGVYWSGVHACHVRTVSDWTAATATVYVSTTRTGVVRWRLIASLWNMRPSTSAQRPISTAAHPPSPRSSSKVRTACLLIFRLCRGVTRLFGRRPGGGAMKCAPTPESRHLGLTPTVWLFLHDNQNSKRLLR